MKNSPLRDIFFPSRCCGCDRLTGSTLPFCEDCEKLVIRPSRKTGLCDICGLHLTECVCGKRLYYEKFSAVFYHENKARRNIFRLKFHARPDIADNYGKAMEILLGERNILQQTDVITFIPMRPFSQLKRGYNQAQLIAKRLSVHTGIPCIPLLKKVFSTNVQHNLGGLARSGNLLGAFEPVKENIKFLEGKRILIIDDVCTTGNTLNEAAKTLLIFGAESVFASACTVRKKSKKTVEEK